MEFSNTSNNGNKSEDRNNQRPKTSQATTRQSQLYNTNCKRNANYYNNNNNINANRYTSAKTEIDSDELLYLEPLHSEEKMNYIPSAKCKQPNYLTKRAMTSMFGKTTTHNNNNIRNRSSNFSINSNNNNTLVKQTTVPNTVATNNVVSDKNKTINIDNNSKTSKNNLSVEQCKTEEQQISGDNVIINTTTTKLSDHKEDGSESANTLNKEHCADNCFNTVESSAQEEIVNTSNAKPSARELVNALYVNSNDIIVNEKLRRVVSSVVIAVDPLNCNAGTPFPSAAKTIEVDLEINFEPYKEHVVSNSSRTTRLVYFASRQPPEPVMAEEQERYISAFVKIHCTKTHNNAEHVCNELNETQNISKSDNSNNNSAVDASTQNNNNQDEESDFYVAFGTVLGYSDSGDAIIWHKRGELFASRLYLSDILELHRADAIRCHHCDQVFLSEELEPHIQTHLKSDWAVEFVEDAEFGTACGDTSLLHRCKARCRLGEGAQGVVWLCELVKTPYRQINIVNNNKNNIKNDGNNKAESKKEGRKMTVAQSSGSASLTNANGDSNATVLQKSHIKGEEKQSKGKENDLTKWFSKIMKLNSSKEKEKKKVDKVKVNELFSPTQPSTANTTTKAAEGDLFFEINVNTSNAVKNNSSISSSSSTITTVELNKAKEQDLAKQDEHHEYVVIKVMHIKNVDTCRALYHQLVRYMTSLTCDHLVEYLAVQMMPNKHTLRIFMPYYSEGNFVEFIRRESNKEHIAESRIQSWMLQLAKSLQFLHDRNPPIVHGDVKADNVMLFNHNDQVVLMDMETSKELRLHQSTIHSADGTNEYMAPETVRYARLMPASDMWSLGVLFYVLTVMPEFPMIIHPITKESTLLNSNCWVTDEELHHLQEYSDMKTYCKRNSLNALSTHSVAKRVQYTSCQWNKTDNIAVSDTANKSTPDQENVSLTITSPTSPKTGSVSLPECVAFEMAKYGYSNNFIQLIMDLLNFDPLARPSASEVIDRLIIMMTQNLIH